MVSAYTVALVGFAQNESATFESFFRLAARRPPAYAVQDEVMDAQLLIVNADNAQALHLVRYAELPGKVLLVGQNDGGTGWPLQRKPIKLVSVLGMLDELVGVKKAATGAPAAHAPATAIRQGGDRGFAATEPYASAAVPLAPAGQASNRRGPNTEFPNTRPMVRRMAAAANPAPPMPVLKPAPAVQLEKTQAARPGVMGVTNFGGLGLEEKTHLVEETLLHHLGKTAEILVFLLGAMTIVEIIDYFDGFSTIKTFIKTKKKATLLWIFSILAFILSAIIDNLTATIVLI